MTPLRALTRERLTSDLVEYIQSAYEYEPDTGIVRQTIDTQQRSAGTDVRHLRRLGSTRELRYRVRVYYNGVKYDVMVPNIAWILLRGRLPYEDHVIDHWNGDAMDDRLENLKEKTAHHNKKNRKVSKRSKVGHQYVSQKGGRYYVRVPLGPRKEHHFGGFATLEEAITARDKYIQDHPETFKHKNLETLRSAA